MKKIVGILRDHLRFEVRPLQLALTLVFLALLVTAEYVFDIKKALFSTEYERIDIFWKYLLLYGIPYLVAFVILSFFIKDRLLASGTFWILFLIAIVSFALRGATFFHRDAIDAHFPGLDSWYWMKTLNNLLLGPILCFVPILHYLIAGEKGMHGMKIRGLSFKPYFIMLLIMVPLIAVASTTKDFYSYYPRVHKALAETQDHFNKKIALFEFAYGWDFIWIELFFRGFLVLAFVRLLGKDAILPMAVFYCSIHFGKPLGETVSSFFGGYLLGLVSYHTHSVAGGALVHMGIAWLMEIGGFAGRYFFGDP